MRRTNLKHTPYGYITVNGEIIGRRDTIRAAEKEAVLIRRSFATANLKPEVKVVPCFIGTSSK